MYRLFNLLWLWSIAIVCYALPTDSTQPLHITADSSTFNYKTGKNIYEGNVNITQGSTHLFAEKLITQSNQSHKIEVAIAYGMHQLAEYTTLPKPNDLPLHAKAKIIKFYPLESKVILEEEVEVTQGENSFTGPIIIYDMKTQIVTAPASKAGRSTLIIDSKQLNS